MNSIAKRAAIPCLLLFVCAGSVGADANRLLGYWRFAEGEGDVVNDVSGKGNDGHVRRIGQRVFRVAGRSGTALEFRNDEVRDSRGENGCVVVRGLENHDFTSEFSVVAWVRLADHQRPRTYEIVTNTLSDRGPGFRLRISWNTIGFYAGDGENAYGAVSNPSSIPLRSDEWYHVVGTYQDSVFRVFVNGRLAGERGPGEQKMTVGATTLTIGAYREGFAYGFNGLIDEVKLVNYALSEVEVMADYIR